MLIGKIVSGGQTGVDRGALEAAYDLGFPYGGLIPKGRLAEDGIVPEKFDRMEVATLAVAVFGLMALTGWNMFAAEQVVPVGNVGDGERVTVMRADSNGVPRTVGNVRVERTIRSLLEAPVGAVYAPDAADFAALKAATKPEIVVRVPAWQTATAPQYWLRPRAVLLKRGTLETVGFFSVSREFATQRETMDYFADTIGGALREHFKKEPMVYPRGNAEFSFPYNKDGRDFELRFKCFAVDGKERSVILCYHGLSRGEKSMDEEFKAFYAFVAEE